MISNLNIDLFSPAQCVGYVAFVLGVAAFLQKSDRRLKFLSASQCLIYAVHFALLGNPSASTSSFISSVRSFLALRTRSRLLAALIIVINLTVGAAVVRNGLGWLPVISSCAATYAVFVMKGIQLRLVLLSCTFLWLANNIISGSIGGTLLEAVIAVVNTSTIVRILTSAERKPLVPAEGALKRAS